MHLGVLGRRRELPFQRGKVPLEPRDPLLRLGELLALAAQLAVEDRGLAADLEQLLLQLGDDLAQILLDLLEEHRLRRLREHEQQDDRAEAAADAVEDRQAEHVEIALLALPHGQSLAGQKYDPRVLSASRQNALAARGSPSIG